MSDRERFDTSQAAVVATTARTGPTAERHTSALGRYLAAVADAREQPATIDHPLRHESSWNLENNLVRDVMTPRVVSVHEDAPFKEIVDTLARYRVGAVPVVDAREKVLGVVSESDLLAKVVTGGDPRVRIGGRHSTPIETRRKSHAETAGELMHAPAVTVRPDTSVVRAARAAAMAHVRRLPVVDRAGALVGIVTRSDLLRVFLRDDHEIHAHLADMFAGQFCIDTAAVDIAVRDGVVILTGAAERRALIAPLLDAVRTTAGVVGVHDNLTYRVDDTTVPPPTPLY